MNILKYLWFLIACVSVTLSTSGLLFAQDWSYSGKKGPIYWGKLSTQYALCGLGHEQSPINIDTNDTTSSVADLKIHYQDDSVLYEIMDNNQVKAFTNTYARQYLVLDKRRYRLIAFYTHTPSETFVNSESFPAEFDFVNVDESGHRLIMVVLVNQGKFNPAIQQFINRAPIKCGVSCFHRVFIDLNQLLPDIRNDYFEYNGSLTTPPCTEGVKWIILHHHMIISESQIRDLTTINKLNVRPIQLLGTRIVRHAS